MSVCHIEKAQVMTVLCIDRLVNTVFFKPEYQVAPFYFKMTREKRTLKHFLLELGKKIIYYFTQYNNQPVDIKAIASRLKVPKQAVEQKIEKLYLADLVYRSAAKFYTFNDITLMRFIQFVYEQDLEGIDKIDLSQQNLINTLKQFLEMVVEVSMMKFNYERLPGSWFGQMGEIEVPLFQFVKTTTVKGSKTRAYQIDVFGKEKKRHKVWLCECKYTKTPMDIKQVNKLESNYSIPQFAMND